MPVDRCVCYDLSFAQLKQLAHQGQLAFDELSRKTGCSTGCRMCEPYVRLMLLTGRTSFPVLDNHQLQAALARITLERAALHQPEAVHRSPDERR